MSSQLKPFEPLPLSEALHAFIKDSMDRHKANLDTIERLGQMNQTRMNHVWEQIREAIPEAKGQNMVCHKRDDGSYLVALLHDRKEIPSSSDRVRLLLAGLKAEGVTLSQIRGMLESE